MRERNIDISMRLQKALFVLSIVFLVIGSNSVLAFAAEEQNIDKEKIDSIIQEAINTYQIPGIGLGIVENEQIIHLQGYGRADANGRVVTAQTPFIIGSVSKSITAMAIMQLVEEGSVNLDAPVKEYIPDFQLKDKEASEKITIRQLLYHTSGISEAAGLNYYVGEEGTLEQFVERMRDVETNRPVGSTYEYSSANYNILGYVIENVSGQSYGDYIKRNVFEPLEMKNSYISVEEAEKQGLAQGFTPVFGFAMPFTEDIDPGAIPGGYLISSAEDMSRYLIAQMNEGQYKNTELLSEESLEEMHEPAVKTGSDDTFYGMGWFNGKVLDAPVEYHFGGSSNFSTSMIVLPDQSRGFVLLMNYSGSHPILTPAYQLLRYNIISILQEKATLPMSALFVVIWYYNALILGVALFVLIQLIWLPFWYRRIRRKNVLPLWMHMLIRVVDVLVPIALLIGFPIVMGYSWNVLLLYAADVTTATAVLGSLLLIIGCIKMFVIWWRMRVQARVA